jgi:hypothetical protein
MRLLSITLLGEVKLVQRTLADEGDQVQAFTQRSQLSCDGAEATGSMQRFLKPMKEHRMPES